MAEGSNKTDGVISGRTKERKKEKRKTGMQTDPLWVVESEKGEREREEAGSSFSAINAKKQICCKKNAGRCQAKGNIAIWAIIEK